MAAQLKTMQQVADAYQKFIDQLKAQDKKEGDVFFMPRDMANARLSKALEDIQDIIDQWHNRKLGADSDDKDQIWDAMLLTRVDLVNLYSAFSAFVKLPESVHVLVKELDHNRAKLQMFSKNTAINDVDLARMTIDQSLAAIRRINKEFRKLMLADEYDSETAYGRMVDHLVQLSKGFLDQYEHLETAVFVPGRDDGYMLVTYEDNNAFEESQQDKLLQKSMFDDDTEKLQREVTAMKEHMDQMQQDHQKLQSQFIAFMKEQTQTIRQALQQNNDLMAELKSGTSDLLHKVQQLEQKEADKIPNPRIKLASELTDDIMSSPQATKKEDDKIYDDPPTPTLPPMFGEMFKQFQNSQAKEDQGTTTDTANLFNFLGKDLMANLPDLLKLLANTQNLSEVMPILSSLLSTPKTEDETKHTQRLFSGGSPTAGCPFQMPSATQIAQLLFRIYVSLKMVIEPMINQNANVLTNFGWIDEQTLEMYEQLSFVDKPTKPEEDVVFPYQKGRNCPAHPNESKTKTKKKDKKSGKRKIVIYNA